MAQVWIPSLRKRLMLRALELFARFTREQPRPSPPSPSAKAVERILVIELWNIGDIVLAMPFLAQLRSIFSGAKITLLARPYARTVLAGTDLVDEFIDTDLGWSESSVRHNPFAYRWLELARVGRALKRSRFDIAFSSRAHVREYLLLALSGADRTVAFALGHGDAVLTDPIPLGDPNRHKTADWLELLKPFGGPRRQDPPRLKTSEEERRWAKEFLAAHGASVDVRLVAIHPGASVPAKRWPLERFVDIAKAIVQAPNTRVLGFVAPDGYGHELSQVPGVISAMVNLRQLISLVECCDLLIGNDSGPMHIAGALGIPTVAIFGTGINLWFAPLGDGHRLITHTGAGNDVRPYDVSDIPLERVQREVNAVLNDQA